MTNNWILKRHRAEICYELFDICKELDPYECEEELFIGALETFNQLQRGEWRAVAEEFRGVLEEIDPELPEHDDLADLLETLESYETEARK
jgi:hypothetical protein